jgi:protoporphyrin/coproporphyrin ferrochelatase
MAQPRPVGLLLVNLGTPQAPSASATRSFLRQFLSDPRVVEVPRLLWLPVLHGVVLTTRPQKSARNYKRIWDRETGEGPLQAITRRQAEKLQLAAQGGALGPGEIIVEYAMRYGAPALATGLEALMAKGCERIAVLPLYPQYAASTTATAFDEIARVMRGLRGQPTLRFAPPYYDDPAYIEALAQSLRRTLAAQDVAPEVVLASFHGLPQLQIDRGDPYGAQCRATAELLREALGLEAARFRSAFQSRFGRAQWMKPYTKDVAIELARQGVKRLAIIAPGFAADCLETLDELAREIRHDFLSAGGEEFLCVPCLNDSPEGMRLIETLARRALAGFA